MKKALYRITLIEPGLEHLWEDYWEGDQSQEALEAHLDGRISLYVHVEASSIGEACKIARAQHPGKSVVMKGSTKIADK